MHRVRSRIGAAAKGKNAASWRDRPGRSRARAPATSRLNQGPAAPAWPARGSTFPPSPFSASPMSATCGRQEAFSRPLTHPLRLGTFMVPDGTYRPAHLHRSPRRADARQAHRRAQRRGHQHRERHSRLPRAAGVAARPPAHAVSRVRGKRGRAPPLLVAQRRRLVPAHPREAQRCPSRRGAPGTRRRGDGSDHAERGPSPPGGREPARARTARIARSGALHGVRAGGDAGGLPGTSRGPEPRVGSRIPQRRRLPTATSTSLPTARRASRSRAASTAKASSNPTSSSLARASLPPACRRPWTWLRSRRCSSWWALHSRSSRDSASWIARFARGSRSLS